MIVLDISFIIKMRFALKTLAKVVIFADIGKFLV